MSFYIGNVLIPNRYILAPMASITNKTFRSICKSMGAGLVVGEMVSDKALIYNSKKTIELLKFSEDERPISQQIFGSEEESMANGAKIIESIMHPDIIDINMGCPVPKVAIKNHAGSALLKNPELAFKIVKAVVNSVSVPVTVKIRIGWDDSNINAVEIAKICEKAGASAIFVHGRTRSQGYSGTPNLDVIKDVVKSVSIPVIGNGDILSAEDAKHMLDYTGCTAVMIGRGALGNPWIFRDCIDYIDNSKKIKEVSIDEKIEMMKYYTEELVKDKNEKIGILEMRTNLMYFLKGLPNTKEIKKKIVECNNKLDLLNIIDEYKNNLQ